MTMGRNIRLGTARAVDRLIRTLFCTLFCLLIFSLTIAGVQTAQAQSTNAGAGSTIPGTVIDNFATIDPARPKRPA